MSETLWTVSYTKQDEPAVTFPTDDISTDAGNQSLHAHVDEAILADAAKVTIKPGA